MRKNIEDQIIQVSKEITIKFIEIGRISPATFPETFELICHSVNRNIKGIIEQEVTATN